MGRKEEGDHKHSANDLKHTNNTAEINGTAQMKKSSSGANGRMFSFFRLKEKRQKRFDRKETVCFLCITNITKTHTGSPAPHFGLSGHISLVMTAPYIPLICRSKP